jgi:hypothetical protein
VTAPRRETHGIRRPDVAKRDGGEAATEPAGRGTTEGAAVPVGRTSGDWAAVVDLASRQHGVVARRQLRGLGFTDRQIDYALHTSRRLHRVHRGVYAVGHTRLSGLGRWSAAVLACGEGAVLAGRSAAALHGLRPSSSRTTSVIVPRAGPLRPAEVRVHRHPGLRDDEVTTVDGIPVTTVARTLLDLAAVLPAGALRKAVKQAEILRFFDLDRVRVLLARHPRHRGTAALRGVLRTWEDPPTARSPQEESFPAFCRRWGLPAPTMNAAVDGMEIDATFPDQRLAVELDGRAFHLGRIAWEDDHERAARLVAAGWTPLAFTYRQLHEDDGAFAARVITAALRRGSAR